MNRDTLLKKWLNNDLDASENEAFKMLDDYQSNLEIIENARYFKACTHAEIDDFNTFKSRYKKPNSAQIKSNWLKPILRIAAILIVSLGIYFSFFFSNRIEFETLAAQKMDIELPDNSLVKLNALSSVEFSKRNWEKNREITLDGEAYFIVAKGKQFDVRTSAGTVSVVGTEFNVKKRQDYFEVKCFEGIVKVSADTLIRQLQAGDIYRIIDGQFSENKTSQTEPLWTNNISSFEGVAISQVLSELERQYDVKISLNNLNTERLFSGGFTHDDLNEALISITQPMNLTFEIKSPNRVVINGQ